MMMVSLTVLATFGSIVGYVTFKLREDIRSRILERAASSLEQVVTSEYRRADEASLLENAKLIEMDLIDLALTSDEVIDARAAAGNHVHIPHIPLRSEHGSLRGALLNSSRTSFGFRRTKMINKCQI